MLKAIIFAALYGISNGYSRRGDESSAVKMCCMANVAMTNSYSICEDVMNRYDESEQEYQCLNGKAMGKVGGVDRCKYAPCEDVGYCVDSKDSDFFDEMTVWEANENERRRSLLSIDQAALHADGWGNGKPIPTPRPTNPPKTPRPTQWKAQPTPRPTMGKAPKTPRPTNTQKPTNPPKTPKPTVWKTPKPTNPPKTPKPTVWKAPKTPKPTQWKAPKTPKPTNPPKIKTPRPTKYAKSEYVPYILYNVHNYTNA